MTELTEHHELGISITLLKQGDRRMFARFVSEFQAMVFACCRAVGLNEQDVEDAAADAFLAAWQAIGKFNEKSKLSSWLWSITYHKAVDCHRRKKMEHASLDAAAVVPAPLQAVSVDSIENAEQKDKLWSAVAGLSTQQAAVIVLFYREDKTIEDIAAILQIPPNTVKTHLHRGRKELYEQLQPLWRTEYAGK